MQALMPPPALRRVLGCTSPRGAGWGWWGILGFLGMLMVLRSAPASGADESLPAWVLALQERGTVVRTSHARVIVEPGRSVGRGELEALEAGIDSILVRLAAYERLEPVLRRSPLTYVVVRDPELMRRLSEADVEGISFPGQRLALSTRLPHRHELVHLLAHAALRNAPAGEEPFLQEGLASWLGGDGEETAAVLLARADRLLDERPLDPSWWFGSQAFRGPGPLRVADRYAIAGRFVQFLAALRGIDHFLSLSRLMAGRPEEVQSRPPALTRLQIEGHYAMAWDDLLHRFRRWRRAHPVEGMETVARPERSADDRLHDGRHRLEVWWEDDGALVIALTAFDGSVDVELGWGEGTEWPPGAAAAPSRRRRFVLGVGQEEAVLRDQAHQQILGRTRAPEPLADPQRWVLRIAPRLVGRAQPRPPWILWSPARYEP